MRAFLILILFPIIVGILLFLIVRMVIYSSEPISISPIPKSKGQVIQAQTSSELGRVIEESLQGTTGTYGIVVKNLKTNESYSSKEHRVFEPGSLYKLWVMATVFQQLESGKLKLSDKMTQEISVLNDKFNIATESAEMTDGEISLSVEEALDQMITISHNYAALLLSEKVKLSNITSFLKKYGFEESSIGSKDGTPKTTPYDISLYFEKLYKGDLGNSSSTKDMIELLKRQKLNNKLPKYLPDNVEIAHKTGELGYFTHDAGIVYLDKKDYIITAFSESDFPEGAEDRIAEVSQNVYHYFNK